MAFHVTVRLSKWSSVPGTGFGIGIFAGLFAFGAEPGVATPHCSLDQGYNEENCGAGDIECHERENARSTDT